MAERTAAEILGYCERATPEPWDVITVPYCHRVMDGNGAYVLEARATYRAAAWFAAQARADLPRVVCDAVLLREVLRLLTQEYARAGQRGAVWNAAVRMLNGTTYLGGNDEPPEDASV